MIDIKTFLEDRVKNLPTSYVQTETTLLSILEYAQDHGLDYMPYYILKRDNKYWIYCLEEEDMSYKLATTANLLLHITYFLQRICNDYSPAEAVINQCYIRLLTKLQNIYTLETEIDIE